MGFLNPHAEFFRGLDVVFFELSNWPDLDAFRARRANAASGMPDTIPPHVWQIDILDGHWGQNHQVIYPLLPQPEYRTAFAGMRGSPPGGRDAY